MKVECSKCHEWVEMNGRKQKCSVCGWDLLKDFNDEAVPEDASKPEPQPSPSETEATTFSNEDKKENASSTKGKTLSGWMIIMLVIVTFIVAFLFGTLLSMRDAANKAPYLHNMK